MRQRRKSPRVDVEIPVVAQAPGRHVVRGLSRGVSPFGLQMRANRENADKLRPGGHPIGEGEHAVVLVAFALPLAYGLAEVAARARIVHFELVDEETVGFGLEFVSLRRPSRRSLEWFVEQSLVPPV